MVNCSVSGRIIWTQRRCSALPNQFRRHMLVSVESTKSKETRTGSTDDTRSVEIHTSSFQVGLGTPGSPRLTWC